LRVEVGSCAETAIERTTTKPRPNTERIISSLKPELRSAGI